MNPFSKLKLLSSLKTSAPSSRPSTSPPPITPSPPGPTAAPTTTTPSTSKASATAPTLQIPEPGSTGQTGSLSGRPGLAKAIWAAHPDRTTRKLRKLLVSWEELGFFFSFSGTPPRVSSATENSFLKVKVAVAQSVSFLKSIRGLGDIGREASARERDFIEILERYPSLSAASDTTEEDKKELFVAWHSLYLFLHKVLGADPHEVYGESLSFPVGRHGEIEAARRNVRPFREGKLA
jgi:hypothetical protein